MASNPYPIGDPRAALWKVGGQAAVDKGFNTYGQYQDWSARDQRADTWKNIGRAAAVIGGPIAASYAIPAIAGAGGASAASSAVPASIGAPATVGGGGAGMGAAGAFSLGNILKAPLTGLGVQGFLSWLSGRSQNKAAKYATDAQAQGLEKQLALETANQAEQKRQFDAQQAAQKAALDAQNKLDAQKLAAENEDRAYSRQQADYTMGLSKAREAYLEPFRQQALQNRYALMNMLGGR